MPAVVSAFAVRSCQCWSMSRIPPRVGILVKPAKLHARVYHTAIAATLSVFRVRLRISRRVDSSITSPADVCVRVFFSFTPTDVAVTLQGFAEPFIANFTPRRSTSTSADAAVTSLGFAEPLIANFTPCWFFNYAAGQSQYPRLYRPLYGHSRKAIRLCRAFNREFQFHDASSNFRIRVCSTDAAVRS